MRFSGYLSWHYGKALRSIVTFWGTFIIFLYHFFSIGTLTKTLFAPWKRQRQHAPDMFPLGPYVSAISFNLVSCVIGAMIRINTILLGIIVILCALFVAPIACAIWILIPGIGLPTYLGQKITATAYIDEHCSTLKEACAYLFKHPEGVFVLDRLMIARQDLYNHIELWPDAALPESFTAQISVHEAFVLFTTTWQPLNLYLNEREITPEIVGHVAQWYERRHDEIEQATRFWDPEAMLRTPGIGHDWMYGYTPSLDQYTSPISSTHNPLGAFYAYQEELHQLESNLTKLLQNSVLIVGEPGGGRHALIERLADLVKSGNTLPALRNKQIRLLDVDLLLSQSDAEKNTNADLEHLLQEAEDAGDLILVIDQIDHYVAASSKPNIATALSQILQSGRLQIIGITTPQLYHQHIRTNEKLAKNFTVITIPQPGNDELLAVLEHVVFPFEHQYQVFIPYQTLTEIVKACDRLFPSTPFPQKAIDAIDTIITSVKSKSTTQKLFVIRPDHVDTILSEVTHIPFGKISTQEKTTLANLEEYIHKRIIGQENAVHAISASLRRARLVLKNSGKPIGSFLFLGPTGVGKTETAKALAATYFGSEERIVRFDMSQFQTPESIDRLIGSIQRGTTGELVNKVMEQPFSVILLDEFEKAAPAIHNLFLTVLDEGYMTDVFARKIYFRDTILIATSNAGAQFMREKVTTEGSSDTFKDDVVNHVLGEGLFSPELLNRFDGIIVFNPLTPEDLTKIARNLLMKFNEQILKEHHISIDITDELIASIVQKGYDPSFGARPMKRVIAEEIEDVVAKKLLENSVQSGESIQFPTA